MAMSFKLHVSQGPGGEVPAQDAGVCSCQGSSHGQGRMPSMRALSHLERMLGGTQEAWMPAGHLASPHFVNSKMLVPTQQVCHWQDSKTSQLTTSGFSNLSSRRHGSAHFSFKIYWFPKCVLSEIICMLQSVVCHSYNWQLFFFLMAYKIRVCLIISSNFNLMEHTVFLFFFPIADPEPDA